MMHTMKDELDDAWSAFCDADGAMLRGEAWRRFLVEIVRRDAQLNSGSCGTGRIVARLRRSLARHSRSLSRCLHDTRRAGPSVHVNRRAVAADADAAERRAHSGHDEKTHSRSYPPILALSAAEECKEDVPVVTPSEYGDDAWCGDPPTPPPFECRDPWPCTARHELQEQSEAEGALGTTPPLDAVAPPIFDLSQVPPLGLSRYPKGGPSLFFDDDISDSEIPPDDDDDDLPMRILCIPMPDLIAVPRGHPWYARIGCA